MRKHIISKIKGLPIALIGATLGLCTLSNAYNLLGYSSFRNCIMPFGMLIFLVYLIKVIINFEGWKSDYVDNLVTACLYATVSMLLFNFSAFLEQFNHTIGVSLWFLAMLLQIISMIGLLYFHILPKKSMDNVYPSWFVPFLGIVVGDVVGSNIGYYNIQFIILIWGVVAYLILIVLISFRLFKKDIPESARHTKAILIAPVSLVLISYVSLIDKVNINFIYCLLIFFLVSLIYIFSNIKSFFKNGFEYGFAALTFPMAVSSVALITLSQSFENTYIKLAIVLHYYSLVHLTMATIIVIYTYILLIYNCFIKTTKKF